ncbi:putative Bacteriohemerythrin [Azospirillaceae bacterium]
MFFAWNPSLSVGHPDLDSDHRKLIAIVNTLWDSVEQHPTSNAVSGALSELAEYTAYHFDREEYAMRRHCFPNTDKHIDDHNELINRLGALIHLYERGQTEITVETMDFMRHWLMDHFTKTDLTLGQFLKQIGAIL